MSDVMPPSIDAVKSYVRPGENCGILRRTEPASTAAALPALYVKKDSNQ
jgi:hypothetical protein